jgi:hypothetical protein
MVRQVYQSGLRLAFGIWNLPCGAKKRYRKHYNPLDGTGRKKQKSDFSS